MVTRQPHSLVIDRMGRKQAVRFAFPMRSIMGIRVKSDVYDRWIETASARRLLALEAGWLRDIVSGFHGQHLAYVGIDDTPRFLKRSQLRHPFRLGLPWQKNHPCAARVRDDAWPLPDHSVDVVVMQHGLDMSVRPHQMVREAARVLVPHGYIVIVGFSPMSIFGVLRRINVFSTRLPWVVNCVDAHRLRDWLTLLDFRIESVSPVLHLWPLRLLSEGSSRRMDRLLVGRRWLPGNGYILVARKTVAGMTPISPQRWQFLPVGFGAAVPAAFTDGSASSSVPYNLKSEKVTDHES